MSETQMTKKKYRCETRIESRIDLFTNSKSERNEMKQSDVPGVASAAAVSHLREPVPAVGR